MKSQKDLDFQRIKKAIEFVSNQFQNQPTLDEIASHIGLSPFHFQKLFKDWAGVSPKKFLQFISLNHAKYLLKDKEQNLFDTAMDTGFSSSSRLHDLFVNIESMTPGEFKNGGEKLKINCSYAHSLFGLVIVCTTTKGICHVAFIDHENIGMNIVKDKFPNAEITFESDVRHDQVVAFLNNDLHDPEKINLHLKGSNFQMKVWEALLQINAGELVTYGNIANKINKPGASRAVGTAIGSNPIAFLIPCHRVIQSSGHFGGYRWGKATKAAIIGWEASQSIENFSS